MKVFVKKISPHLCLMFLTRTGWGNGYVEVSKDSPLAGMSQDDLEDKFDFIDVHGGITFGNVRSRLPNEEGDGWVFGFDTTHAWSNSSHNKKFVVAEANRLKAMLERAEKELLKEAKGGGEDES